MAYGIPTPLNHLYNVLVPSDSKIETFILRLYYHYLKLCVTLRTQWTYRHHAAPLHPFKIIHIDPSKIEKRMKKDYKLTKELGFILPSIKDGDWHHKTASFDQHHTYIGFKQRFKQNKNWKDTELVKKVSESIKEDGNVYDYGCDDFNEFKEILDNIDTLYTKIESEGYKEQRQIDGSREKVNKIDNINYMLKEINEITVNIGPDGEFIWEEGQHRLTIAKLLNIDKIPVRVLVRHEEWQKKRNMAVRNPEDLPEDLKNHPDIKYLIE